MAMKKKTAKEMFDDGEESDVEYDEDADIDEDDELEDEAPVAPVPKKPSFRERQMEKRIVKQQEPQIPVAIREVTITDELLNQKLNVIMHQIEELTLLIKKLLEE